ncbi:hypothetical protein ANO11243_050030 [Dothideomycetidae sp. 11243]|nr:hypothetical protein ANO11243_050030 [fungal sp. No.11243]
MGKEGRLLLKHILESSGPHSTSFSWLSSSSDEKIFAKMKDGYNACLDEKSLHSIGPQPLIDILRELNHVYSTHSLTGAIYFLMSIGVETPFTLSVGADDKDPDSNVVVLAPPYSFGLPSKQHYNQTTLLDFYKETARVALEALLEEADDIGAPISLSSLHLPEIVDVLNRKIFNDMVDYESRIALSAPDPDYVQDVNKTYNIRTLDEVEAYIPAISVKAIIGNLTNGIKPSKIIVWSPDYLESLADIMASQKHEVIYTYLMWKVIQSYGLEVDSPAVEPLRKFNNKLRGMQPEAKSERWKTCVDAVDGILPWILSRFFVERTFSEEAKDFGDKIVHDIKNQFVAKLKHSAWMTESVRQLAADKSPDITNAEDLSYYYSNVTIHSDAHFANRLSSTRNDIKRTWAKLGHPVDRDEWIMSAPTINGYYNAPGNEIVLPAGIMQAPYFYGLTVPSYLSYGVFGAIAGHELSHAFDPTGASYDQNGNFTDWWDDSTLTAFERKSQCFIKQYENYTIPTKDGPIAVNGKLTLGENIADAGGVIAAFQAWRENEKRSADLLLPGLANFTKEQIFFLAYGMSWCDKSREEEAIDRIHTDPHSPNALRIKGTTANSRDFRKAFHCAAEEPVCELW